MASRLRCLTRRRTEPRTRRRIAENQEWTAVARAVAILSLASACVMDSDGAVPGQRDGRDGLLRACGGACRGRRRRGRSYYCSFMMIALLLTQGPRRASENIASTLGTFAAADDSHVDHIIVWTRPSDRGGCRGDFYAAESPRRSSFREIRYNIVERGRRTRTDRYQSRPCRRDEYSKEDMLSCMASAGIRMDIRSIKVP